MLGIGGAAKGIATANAMAYAGYNPATGKFGDKSMHLKPLDQLVRTGVGALLWLSPAMQITVRDTRGPIRRYLESSKSTAVEAGKSLIAFDVWKTDPFAATGASVFNISTLFIPGVGEASAGLKVRPRLGGWPPRQPT